MVTYSLFVIVYSIVEVTEVHAVLQLDNNFYKHVKEKLPLSSVVKHIAIGAGGLGSIRGPVKADTASQRLVTAATFLRSWVIQAISRGDGLPYSLHASASYSECNEDLIFFFF